MSGEQHQSVMEGNSQIENQNNRPMAVLPLNSSAKLDQEPNPFEQSFSGVQIKDKDKKEGKMTLPSVASITSTSTMPTIPSTVNPIIGGGVLPKEVTSQFTWDSLRTGPLSPSMLQGPTNPDEYYATMKMKSNPSGTTSAHSAMQYKSFSDSQQSYKTENTQHTLAYQQQPCSVIKQRKRSNSQFSDDYSLDSYDSTQKRDTQKKPPSKEITIDEEPTSKRIRSRSSKKNDEDDDKRKSFLERNRIAALKCRQRKKQWLSDLQTKVEYLATDNERLQLQSESLKEEIVNLKTLLLAHKECPVAQANGFHVNTIQKTMPSMMANIPGAVGNPVSHSSTSPTTYINSGMPSLPPPSNAPISSSTHSISQYQSTPQITQQGMAAGGSRASTDRKSVV